INTGSFVFPGLVRGSCISDTSLRNVLRAMGIDKSAASIHGMRSSFRDWAGEETNFPRDVCEHALAHSIPDVTEKAYFRTDQFKRRVELMAAWATFCDGATRHDGAGRHQAQDHDRPVTGPGVPRIRTLA